MDACLYWFVRLRDGANVCVLVVLDIVVFCLIICLLVLCC